MRYERRNVDNDRDLVPSTAGKPHSSLAVKTATNSFIPACTKKMDARRWPWMSVAYSLTNFNAGALGGLQKATNHQERRLLSCSNHIPSLRILRTLQSSV